MFKKSIKYIALLVLVAFTVTFGLPTRQLAYAKSIENIKQGKTDIKYEKPVVSTSLGNFADTLDVHITAMKKSIAQDDLKTFKKQVKDTEKVLKDLRKAIRTELDKNGKTLDRLKAVKAKQKHNQLKAEMEGKLDDFEGLFNKLAELTTLVKELKGKDSETLKNKLEEIEKVLKPEQPEPILGTLPHNNVTLTPPEPAIGNGIAPAYAGGGQTAVSEQTLPKTPVTGDLAETPETQLTPEIKDLADSLGTPVKIYEYVRNSIDFEPYYGARKAAAGTLNQTAGNDYDQASLLIAMLRYKSIPARYVKGTVEVPIEKVKGWTGAETPEAAVKVLGSLGIPTVSVVSGGKIIAARIEHTWVEAYVPYENYRGAGEMKGKKVWVPLDPSFKQYSIEPGLDIKAITGVTDEQILEAFKINADKSADGETITNINIDKMSSFLDEATGKLEKYLKDNNLENADAKQLMGGKKIIPENLGLLPLTLPYKTVTVLSETNTISDTDSEKIGFSIKGNEPFNLDFAGTADFNVEFRAVELYGKRITLSWLPATQEDLNIINNYGGIFKTPAYMIQLKPQLKADGQVIAEGKAVGFGNRQEFTIAMGHTGRPVENVTNPVTAGGFYSISFDYGKIDIKELQAISDRVSALQDTATEESIYTDEVMGEILNSVGKAYFGQLDAFNSLMANATKVSAVRQVSEAMTGYRPNVRYMFYTPVEVTGGSFFIDVDHDVFGVVSLEGKQEKEIGYMMNTGILGSAMEHGIHEQIFQMPSVSAIKVLTEASSRGIPIYTIGKDNIDKLSEISASAAVKTDIRNAVNSGKVVIIPEKEIRYYDWQGAGYIIMDPETGAAGYMIGGGLSGGSVALDIEVTLVGLAVLTWAILDTIAIAQAFIAAANPLISVVFFALAVISTITVAMALQDILMYWQTGDYKYASQLMGDLLLNLACFGLFKVLEAVLPGIMAIFKSVKNQMDEVAQAAKLIGDDLAEAIARVSGPDALPRAAELLKKLDDIGIDPNFSRNIANKTGIEGLETAAEVITKYGDDAIIAMKNGIEPSLIKRLDDLGIKPTDFERLRITSREAAEAVAEAIQTATTKARAIGIVDEVQLTKIGENAAEAMSKGRKFTEPTLPTGGKPRGNYEVPDINDPRPKELQNQAADLLANKGYDIEMLPEKIGGNGYGVTPGSNPDYLIDGIAFDCYSPKAGTSVRNIWSTVKGKVEEQARRIILNLDDYAGSLDDISKQFYDWNHDLPGLEELIIVKNGKTSRLIMN